MAQVMALEPDAAEWEHVMAQQARQPDAARH